MLQVEYLGWASEEGGGRSVSPHFPATVLYAQRGAEEHREAARDSRQGRTRNTKRNRRNGGSWFCWVMEFWGLPSVSIAISFVQQTNTISFSEYD